MNPFQRRAALSRALQLTLGWAAACGLAGPRQAQAAANAGPTEHGLLIGVSRYPSLPKRLWLQGPRDDVALMREALLARGMPSASLRELVDDPTRQDILQAMQQLSQRVKTGDRVFFYFAGHGSQQPAAPDAPWPEPDGLDEVILPSDARAWRGDSSQPAIPNAIVDDEIGRWMDGLVDRGAQVWAVFDTCHAAGMGRQDDRPDARPGPKVRALHPAELGLPEAALKPTPARQRLVQGRLDGRTLLFAGRSHERVREEWLPRGGSLASTRLHGVFTWHLAALIQAQGWQDGPRLLAQVRERFKAEGRISPMPMGWIDPALQTSRS